MKRSKKATLTIMATVSIITGCERVPVTTFTSLAECETRFQSNVCADAFFKAESLHNTSSPKYEQLDDCEYDYDQCSSTGTGYIPRFSGVVVPDTPNHSPFPVYRNRGDHMMHNANGSAYFMPRRHMYVNASNVNVTHGDRVAKRGGFGSIGASKSRYTFGG